MLPALAGFPPAQVQAHLPSAEWQIYLEAWVQSIQLRLRLTDDSFRGLSSDEIGIPFLLTYLSASTSLSKIEKSPSAISLRQHSYLLLKRFLLVSKIDVPCQVLIALLGGGSRCYLTVSDWKITLTNVWKLKQPQVKKALDLEKAELLKDVNLDPLLQRLERLTMLSRCLPQVTSVTMAGADFLEMLMETYSTTTPNAQRVLTAFLCHSFIGLILSKQTSLLLDNLYHMKSEAEQQLKLQPESPTLLSNLVCNTVFLRHLFVELETSRRQKSLVDDLTKYRVRMLHLHPPPETRKKAKGKGKARGEEHMHIHKAALVSQVHELFPDLHTNYILRLLDHFSDNAEAVVAALLEPDSLPPALQDKEDNEEESAIQPEEVFDLEPRPTPPMPPQRRNVFDDDDFDQLRISESKVSRGKKQVVLQENLTEHEHNRSKAAIMAALAAFDADDDERDDSYDVADVGATVDNSIDTDERRGQDFDRHEGYLFSAWKETPELFARDSKTRASNIRQQLKEETGMTDEQIEGWAVMLKRDPKMEDRLRIKHSTQRSFKGNQRALESTKWTASTSTENSEAESGSDAPNSGRRMGQAGIRGHRTFGQARGRGGSTSGPPDSSATQAARRRKEQGKGRGGASHNRREGRAKKIGRGMAGPMA